MIGGDVFVAGVGSTTYGVSDRNLRSLAAEASAAAIADAELEPGDIDAVFVGAFTPGSFVKQEHVAPLVAEEAGVSGVPALRTEGACASGSLAFSAAATSVAAGMHRAVLVVGLEKMTHVDSATGGSYLMLAGDAEREGAMKLPFPGVFAMLAHRHAHEYGTAREHLDAVAIKAHDNALRNPKAQFQRAISADDIRASRIVCAPLTLFDCAPLSDGASALVLTSSSIPPARGERISVLGIGQASDTLSFVDRPSLTGFAASRLAAARAYDAAGMGPADIDLAEVHDCFTIAEIIAMEDLGFFEPGHAAPAVVEGRTRADGDLPVNLSGGLKGKGHPVGATGVGQIGESVLRLRGHDPRVQDAGVALTHNLGGSGATAVVTIVGRES